MTVIQDMPWLSSPGVAPLMRELESLGETRVVGGSVRDVLLGKTPDDLDLATLIPMEALLETLARNGWKTFRHPFMDSVAFAETDDFEFSVGVVHDWRDDALGRDLTINGLSAGADGKVHDHVNGLEDVASRTIRFIGGADASIGRDPVRMIRYFRFHAHFSANPHDPADLDAIRRHAASIKTPPTIRVLREIEKLVSELPEPVPVLRLMEDCGLLGAAIPGIDVEGLAASWDEVRDRSPAMKMMHLIDVSWRSKAIPKPGL